MLDLKILRVGGVDYNIGFSTNDLTDDLKQRYDDNVEATTTNATDINNLEAALSGLTVVKITEGLESNVKEAYQLQDKDGKAIGEMMKVYNDSSLQNVVFEDQKLIFTYLLNDGTTTEAEVDISAFLLESEFKNGLQVTDGVVSVKLGEDTDSNKNFLDFEGTEEGAQSLAVRGMDANKTVTSAAIPVAGGPLASLTQSVIGSEIAAGTDIEALLFSLFCKELWPTNISTSNASLTSSVAAPTINMSTTTVEVGSSVNYSVANGASSYSASPYKVSNLTYGYSNEDDDKKDSSNTTVSAAFGTISIFGDDVTTLTVTSTGNEQQNANGTHAASSASLTGTIKAIEGANTVNASNTSVTYQGTCSALDAVYGCSNIGNTDANYKSTAKSEATLQSTVVSKSASKAFTGAYKYYIGYANAVPTDTTGIKALTTHSGWITKGGTTTISAGGTLPAGKTMVIAVQNGYGLNSIMNGFDLESKDSFALSTVSYTLADSSNVTYNVYAMSSAADWNYKTISLK